MDDLVKRLRDIGDHAAFEPHMHHVAADAIEALQALVRELEHDRMMAEKDAEIARLRHQIHEASDPDFLFGAMDNVYDFGVSIETFADAASRAIRAALENRDADT